MTSVPPNDITRDFILKLFYNAQKANYEVNDGWGPGYSWFRGKVASGKAWDFKDNDYKSYKDTGVIVCGREYRNDMPGNFHYGFVGKAAGFSNWTLFNAAGAAQIKAGTSSRKYHCTNYDDPEDQEFIRLGILLYKLCGIHVDKYNLGEILGRRNEKTCGPNFKKILLEQGIKQIF